MLHVMSRTGRVCLLLVMLGMFFPVSMGCGGAYTKPETKAELGIKTIAVLPFEEEVTAEPGKEYISCTVCGSTYKGGHIEPRANMVLTDILFEKLKDKPNIILLTPGQSKGLWADVFAGSMGLPYVEVLQKIGEKSGADAVLYGRIFRYEERVGKTYSVQSPASVAFDLHLVRTSDGAIIWKERFDEAQTSLMENILKLPSHLKRGFKWLTVDELAREGMDEVMNSFPYL